MHYRLAVRGHVSASLGSYRVLVFLTEYTSQVITVNEFNHTVAWNSAGCWASFIYLISLNVEISHARTHARTHSHTLTYIHTYIYIYKYILKSCIALNIAQCKM